MRFTSPSQIKETFKKRPSEITSICVNVLKRCTYFVCLYCELYVFFLSTCFLLLVSFWSRFYLLTAKMNSGSEAVVSSQRPLNNASLWVWLQRRSSASKRCITAFIKLASRVFSVKSGIKCRCDPHENINIWIGTS